MESLRLMNTESGDAEGSWNTHGESGDTEAHGAHMESLAMLRLTEHMKSLVMLRFMEHMRESGGAEVLMEHMESLVMLRLM